MRDEEEEGSGRERKRVVSKQVRWMKRGKGGDRKAPVGYVKGMDERGKAERGEMSCCEAGMREKD